MTTTSNDTNITATLDEDSQRASCTFFKLPLSCVFDVDNWTRLNARSF